MSAIDDLLESIFDARNHALRDEFEQWVRDSRRFSAFAAANRSKIRAKLRNSPDGDGLRDLRAEFGAAAALLRDERFALEYEAYAAQKQRGPDFTVTFRTRTRFNVEVRRIRAGAADGGGAEASSRKLVAVLLDKVGQMPPSMANLLWLDVEGELATDDLDGALAYLRSKAERKEEQFFIRRGFSSAVDFLTHYARLSGVWLWRTDSNSLWLNATARHKLPAEIGAALRKL